MLNNRGFTLIEVLLATVLIIALGLAIIGLQYILTQSRVLFFKNYLDVDQANSSMQTFIREIRTAKFADDGSYLMQLANDQEIIFFSDIDFDGQTERVHYLLNGSQFSRGIIEPTGNPISYPEENEKVKIFSENVRNGETPIFYYYNNDWPGDSENNPLNLSERLSDTRLVRFYLHLNTEPDEPEKDYILDSYAQIRMLKDNL